MSQFITKYFIEGNNTQKYTHVKKATCYVLKLDPFFSKYKKKNTTAALI